MYIAVDAQGRIAGEDEGAPALEGKAGIRYAAGSRMRLRPLGAGGADVIPAGTRAQGLPGEEGFR